MSAMAKISVVYFNDWPAYLRSASSANGEMINGGNIRRRIKLSGNQRLASVISWLK